MKFEASYSGKHGERRIVGYAQSKTSKQRVKK